jgi:hypothetical protein
MQSAPDYINCSSDFNSSMCKFTAHFARSTKSLVGPLETAFVNLSFVVSTSRA